MNRKKIIYSITSLIVLSVIAYSGYFIYAQNLNLKNKVNQLSQPVNNSSASDTSSGKAEQTQSPMVNPTSLPTTNTTPITDVNSKNIAPASTNSTPAPQKICNEDIKNSKIALENSSYNLAVMNENNSYESQLQSAKNTMEAALNDLSNRGFLNSGMADQIRANYAQTETQLNQQHSANLSLLEAQHNTSLAIINNTCY